MLNFIKKLIRKIFFLLLLLVAPKGFSQTICTGFNSSNFVLNGNASVTNSPEVTLTIDQGNLFGTMWSNQEILFDEDFLIESELFFGYNDWGADGIAFVLQPQSSNAGGLGGGIGYEGISPSISIEFDTYYNSGSDPLTNDHVAIIKNGQPFLLIPHSEFITPIDIGNVENGQWHTATFQWTASTQKLKLVFDGVQLFDVTINLTTIFPSNNSVFWGFTSATGGANNLQKVKINNYCVTLDTNIPQVVINSNLNYCDSNSCKIISPIISISEPNTIISGAKVYFTSNYVTGEDILSFTPNFGITGSFDALTGVLSLNGSTSIANYEQVLESVCYQNNAVNPTPGNRVVTYVIGDLLYNATNQHFYKLITSLAPIQWTEATTNALNTNYFGLPGYLVTITDQQENDFINSLINSNSWLGATDTNIEGEWRWVTGCEGQENSGLGRLFSLQQFNAIGISVNSNYINWACIEPNNCCGGENYLHMIGPNSILCGNFGEWNDYPNSGIPYTGAPPVTNYIIEYGCSNNSIYSNLSASVVISVEIEIESTFTQIADICKGGLLPTLPTTSNNGFLGSWAPSVNNNSTTTYTFTPNTGQCANLATMTITVISPEINQSSATQYFCQGGTVSDLLPQGNDILWYSSLNSSLPLDTNTVLENNVVYFASRIINYCESEQRIQVKVFTNCEIPKGVSANGDGLNDWLDLSFMNGVELQIFNRYGMVVYTKSNYYKEWNGKDNNSNSLPSGVYYYVIKNTNNENKTGWIYLTTD
jgi:gliding motility-associated-like protein